MFKRKPILIESDRGKELYINFFQKNLINNNIKHYSKNSSFGSVFAKRFHRTTRDLVKDMFLKEEMQFGLQFYLQ